MVIIIVLLDGDYNFDYSFKYVYVQILDLLKYLILSMTPSTSMFLSENYITVDKSIQIMNSQLSTEGVVSFKKMEVKVLVQKSNNKIILAHSSEDFIELFCSAFSRFL